MKRRNDVHTYCYRFRRFIVYNCKFANKDTISFFLLLIEKCRISPRSHKGLLFLFWTWCGGTKAWLIVARAVFGGNKSKLKILSSRKRGSIIRSHYFLFWLIYSGWLWENQWRLDGTEERKKPHSKDKVWTNHLTAEFSRSLVLAGGRCRSFERSLACYFFSSFPLHHHDGTDRVFCSHRCLYQQTDSKEAWWCSSQNELGWNQLCHRFP